MKGLSVNVRIEGLERLKKAIESFEWVTQELEEASSLVKASVLDGADND